MKNEFIFLIFSFIYGPFRSNIELIRIHRRLQRLSKTFIDVRSFCYVEICINVYLAFSNWDADVSRLTKYLIRGNRMLSATGGWNNGIGCFRDPPRNGQEEKIT